MSTTHRDPLVDITVEASTKPTCACDGPDHGLQCQNDLAKRAFQDILEAARTVQTENPLPLTMLLLPTKAPAQRQQLQPGTKHSRGLGFPLAFRMAVVDIFRFTHKHNPKVTAHNFHKYVNLDLDKNSVPTWEKEYDKIKFDVQHGRGSYCKLSTDEDDVVLHYVNMSVVQWLELMRSRGFRVGGQQMSKAAKSMYFALVDSCSPEFRRPGREPAFTASWRASMERNYGVVDCKVTCQEGLVDVKDPDFITRMGNIRKICGQYSLDDIYNCDETGMYLRELFGGKSAKGPRVSILFCINASGSSLVRSQHMTALRPYALSKHMPQDKGVVPTHLMTSIKNESGYMTSSLFLAWLRLFDNQLTRPTLLILGSCTAHVGIEEGDQERGRPWKHIHIERLPPNSTSITQPLDKGVISVFKRCFLEMLCDKSISASFGSDEAITNGLAWSLIPYAWSHIKESTLRHCFRAAKVLPLTKEKEQDALDLIPPDVEQERQPLWPPVQPSSQQQIGEKFMRFIASATSGGDFKFSHSKEGDAQEVAEAAARMLRREMQAKRAIWKKRERSSSLEPEEIASYDASTQEERTAAELKRLLTNNDPAFRRAARYLVRQTNRQYIISSQNKNI